MESIKPPIKPDETGDHVANLQAALVFLLDRDLTLFFDPQKTPSADDLKAITEKLIVEAATKYFDKVTRALTFAFQQRQGLDPQLNGVVDPSTANALNKHLQKYSALEPNPTYEVFGAVHDAADDAPVAGIRVIAHDLDFGRPTVIGETRADADGRYRITFKDADFRATASERGGPELVVHAVDDKGVVIGKSKTVNNAGLRTELHIKTNLGHTVRGKVSDSLGRPLPGLKVVAFDRDLRRHQWLNDASSDAQGFYEIRYRPEDFRRAEGERPLAADLFVVVLPGDGLEPVATSEVRFNAKPVEIIDLVVSAVDDGPSEFERVTALVMPLLVGQGTPRTLLHVVAEPIPTDLQPHAINAEDIDFIAGETGLDAVAIQAWAEGARLLDEAQQLQPQDASADDRDALKSHAWPFFFGWRKAGLAPGLAAALDAEPEQWAASLRVAQARGWIPPVSERQASTLQDALERLRAIARLDPVYAADPLFAAVGAQATGLPAGVALKALSLYREKGLDGLADFAEMASADPTMERGLAVMATTLRVYDLADGSTDLIQPIMQRLDGSTTGLEPLAGLGMDDWTRLAMEAGLAETAAQNKAAVLQLKAEQLHPTEALQARIAGNEVTLDGYNQGELGAILKSNIKSVDKLLHGGALDSADVFATEHAELAGQMRDLGRWVRTGAGISAGADLIKLGFKSPGVLTNYGPPVIDLILPSLPPHIRDIIVANLDKFRRNLETILGEGGSFTYRPPLGPPHGSPPTPQVDPLPPQVPGISAPTVRGMFGDLDDCVCRPCESVLGQGAYLVDLLNLLKREVVVRGTTGAGLQTGLDLMRARRPDILDLELSCENSEVLLPHVDLALEALEWRVASTQLGFGSSAARPVTDWFRPTLDANLLALLRQTSSGALGAVQSAVDARNPLLWRVTDGLRTWLIEALPLTGSPGQARTFRLISLSIRRTEASPDPRIEPAHRNPMAYGTVGAAIFPWSLPFDRTTAESRCFIDALQLPRLVLMELSAATIRVDRVNEILGLTATERALLESERTGDALWQAWGFANAVQITVVDPDSAEELVNQTPQQLLQRASFLLARSGLALAELEPVLASRFVGGLTLTERQQCKASLMRVAPSIGPETLDRLHRFVRLWRKLPGCSVELLDSTLVALNPLPSPITYTMDYDVLAGVATVLEARRLLDLPTAVVLGLQAPLSVLAVGAGNNPGPVNLFANVFLANRVGAVARALFAQLASPGSAVQNKLADNLDALAAALGEEAPVLAQSLLLIPAALGDALSHDTLTWLYRHVTLSRALGVSVLELRLLVELTGLEPIGPAVPPTTASSVIRAAGFAALLAFGKAAAKIDESQFSIALLADVLLPESHVLRPAMQPLGELKSADQVTTELKSLRQEMRNAEPAPEPETEARAQQVRTALSRLMATGTAEQVLGVLAEPQMPAAPDLVAALSGRSIVEQDPFGIGLLTPAQANELLSAPLSHLTLADRLAQIHSACGALARRLALVGMLESWTGLVPEALTKLLQHDLKIHSGAGADAFSVLTHPDFWSRDSTTPIDAEIIGWSKQLDRLMALLKGMDPSLALMMLPGRNWETVILPTGVTSGVTRWQTLEPILDLHWLAKPLQLGEAVLRAHVEALAATGAAANPSATIAPLARRLDINPTEVLAMTAHTTGASATIVVLRAPVHLRRVTELAALARRLRATVGQLAVLAGADAAQVAFTARQILATRVGAEAWNDTLTTISDALRKQQRDALVDYLLQITPGLADANSLYEQLLIDPQVQPCFMTTRITQAVASVQLLVQRMLFGLEREALVSDALRERWGWMRSYRLWEANRKVFLYPENWLFPELRDDKSPAFRRLESTLGQEELNQERAGQAFGQFLDNINHIGQTEVLGLFEDFDARGSAAGQQRIRHLVIVGRSPNPPYLYHWRRCRDFGKRWMEWSPWERIEVDIQGDHVMPFVANGIFHVAWPIIHKQTAAEKPTATGSAVADKWRVELAWSAFDGISWRQVSTSRDNARWFDQLAFENERSGFAFRPCISTSGGDPSIDVYAKTPLPNATRTIDEPLPKVSLSEIATLGDLVRTWGDAQLAALLFGNVNSLAENYYNLLQFYCTRMSPAPSAPPSGATNSELAEYAANLAKYRLSMMGYWLISIRDVLVDPDKLAWHLRVRGESIKPIVDGLRYSKPEIEAFIRDYRAHTSRDTFLGLVKVILANCSARLLKFRAWVQLTSNSNDFLELKWDDGTFTLQLSDWPSRITLAPEYPSEAMIRVDTTPGGSGHFATLTWTPKGKLDTFSEALELVPVPKGQSSLEILHFKLSDPTNKSGLAWRLQAPRPFLKVQKFTLQSAGTMATRAGDNAPLELLDISSSDVWMNGFKELEASSRSLPLTLRKALQSPIPVFAASNASARYWVVAASAPGASALNQSNLWYFSEQATACLIDVSPTPATDASGSDISIYPSAWPMGDTLSRAWYETGHLPKGGAQSDDFGANRLPGLASGMRTALPSAVTQGRWSFDNRLPNACYNWEIYFHAPLLIADQLSKQQRFEDAERWLRMVFDPNSVEPGQPQAFLRFRVFRELPLGQSVANDLKSLARSVGRASTPFVETINALIARWRSQPYRPFVIARRRHVAFLWRTVFAYLDNLLAWADSWYRRDTREAIGEAAQLYILAARILGPKPRMSRAHRAQNASSYTDLAEKWDDFANAWFDATLPAVSQPPPPPPVTGVAGANQTPAPEGFLFFCIPVNEKLNTYWDLVNERLFNIRHCRNLEGITRDLPLTDPPIDPELLVRATAAGLNLNDVVNDLFARPLPYRYSVLAARAMDLAGDVRAFGSALLSALEKRDGEQLAQLRSINEIELLKRVSAVRTLQIEEAERNLDALRASRAGSAARYEQIQRQLGMTDKRAPGEQETIGEESQLGRPASGSTLATSQWGLIVEEQRQMEEQTTAGFWTDADSVARVVGGAFSLGASVAHAIPGGDQAGKVLSALASAGAATADAFRAISQIHQTSASRQATSAGHIRRRDEWAYQANQVLRELRQMDKQILANEIRIALTRAELHNHEAQIEQSEAIDTYLHEKFTSAELYDWMSSQLSNLHSAAYRMALNMARRAERAAAHELGVPALNLIRADYWNSRRSSLVAGERLHQDIKRLEIAYLEQNRREFELTKHVSLRRLNPLALLNLKATAACQFDIPEWLFDMDTPGHYMRRIKTVSLSVPCVVGPYANVNCKLTLLKNETRHASSSSGSYPKTESEDDTRFTVRYGAAESIVTSTGRDDSGLFETALRDERYLPFESAGAISTWRLELPGAPRQFDFDTISDVILHIRYTARDGGDGLKGKALEQFTALIPPAARRTMPPGGYPRVLISCRNEFANEWAAAAANAASLKIELSVTLLPYWVHALGLEISGVSTIPWTANSSSFTPSVLWPVPAGGRVQPDLRSDGTGGLADLGAVPPEADDIFVLLDVRSR